MINDILLIFQYIQNIFKILILQIENDLQNKLQYNFLTKFNYFYCNLLEIIFSYHIFYSFNDIIDISKIITITIKILIIDSLHYRMQRREDIK